MACAVRGGLWRLCTDHLQSPRRCAALGLGRGLHHQRHTAHIRGPGCSPGCVQETAGPSLGSGCPLRLLPAAGTLPCHAIGSPCRGGHGGIVRPPARGQRRHDASQALHPKRAPPAGTACFLLRSIERLRRRALLRAAPVRSRPRPAFIPIPGARDGSTCPGEIACTSSRCCV